VVGYGENLSAPRGALTPALGVMKQSPLLEFESSAFQDAPSEGELTNPGISGKSLTQWLSTQLRVQGFGSGEVMSEDFGWCVPLESKPHRLYVACSSAQEAANHWQVFVFAEGGLMSRLLGKDTSSQSVAVAFNAVKEILQTSPRVQGLRQQAYEA
jgi:hypothetical protein